MREILLTKGMVTLVDDADYKKLSRWKWSYDRYAYRTILHKDGKKSSWRMHRELLSPPPKMHVDHINGNPLDNRRSNLRICTPAENIRNCRGRNKTSKYHGVSWDKSRNKWKVALGYDYGCYQICRVDSEEEAAYIADQIRLQFHGDHIRLNLL